jgi:hypothetical protein
MGFFASERRRSGWILRTGPGWNAAVKELPKTPPKGDWLNLGAVFRAVQRNGMWFSSLLIGAAGLR